MRQRAFISSLMVMEFLTFLPEKRGHRDRVGLGDPLGLLIVSAADGELENPVCSFTTPDPWVS